MDWEEDGVRGRRTRQTTTRGAWTTCLANESDGADARLLQLGDVGLFGGLGVVWW
jgi:hypothetical protein